MEAIASVFKARVGVDEAMGELTAMSGLSTASLSPQQKRVRLSKSFD